MLQVSYLFDDIIDICEGFGCLLHPFPSDVIEHERQKGDNYAEYDGKDSDW